MLFNPLAASVFSPLGQPSNGAVNSGGSTGVSGTGLLLPVFTDSATGTTPPLDQVVTVVWGGADPETYAAGTPIDMTDASWTMTNPDAINTDQYSLSFEYDSGFLETGVFTSSGSQAGLTVLDDGTSFVTIQGSWALLQSFLAGSTGLSLDLEITSADDVSGAHVRLFSYIPDVSSGEGVYAVEVTGTPALPYTWQGYNYQTALGTDDVGYTWSTATNQASDVYTAYRNNAVIAALAGFTVGSNLPYDNIGTGDAIQQRGVGFLAPSDLIATDGVKNEAGANTAKFVMTENTGSAYPASAGRVGEAIYCTVHP